MKALILDVDGVLNGHGVRGLDPEKLDLIAHIVQQTGCVICLSSTWRRLPDQRGRLIHALLDRGVELEYQTPILDEASGSIFSAKTRTDEIQSWLSSVRRRHTLESFVILDDDPSCEIYGDLLPHLVKTDTYTGLTPAQAQEVIERLNQPTKPITLSSHFGLKSESFAEFIEENAHKLP
jgi:hypothetical protein